MLRINCSIERIKNINEVDYLIKPKVLIGAHVPSEVEEYIGKYCDYEKFEKEETITYEKILAKLNDKEGLLENVGPMVAAAPEEKPLSIALREMNEGMLQYTQIDPEQEAAERTAEADPAFSFVDPFAEAPQDPNQAS